MGSPKRALIVISLAGTLGILLPAALLLALLWQQTIRAEEHRLAQLSQELAAQTEAAIVDAISLLQSLNAGTPEPCSVDHLETLQNEALARPHVRAIGFWRAIERLCGVGLIQGQALMPPQASRIYDSGLVAWWPNETTTTAGTALFLMRFGNHDIAIDPRLLINPGLLERKQVVLWVEGMIMSSFPDDATLPAPDSVPLGLTVQRAERQIISRSSLGSTFPIEIIAAQSMDEFWQRYRPLLTGVGSVGLALSVLWLIPVWRYLSHQFSVQMALRAAINGRRISASYQPIVDLSSGRCIGAEVLGRWTEGNGSSISPDIFVPLAEKAGMGTELTLAVLERMLADLADWQAVDPGLVYHLNLTEQDLTEPRFSQRLQQMLRSAGLPPERLELEITERALLDTDQVRERVAELRGRGHPISIDDFGTGFSSLSYLQRFQLDTLKIDKSFVDALATEAVTSSVILPIIDMARSLGLAVIAEGIEARGQVDWLLAHGVTRGQGYWYSPPLAGKAFETWYLETLQ